MNSNGHAAKRLNLPVIALVTSLVLLTGTAARADILDSGAVFGGATQNNANCYATNTGAPITITAAAIRNQAGASVTLSINTCTGKTLAQFATCAMDTPSGSLTIQTYECDFQTFGTTADLRGVFDIRDSSQNILVSVPLR